MLPRRIDPGLYKVTFKRSGDVVDCDCDGQKFFRRDEGYEGWMFSIDDDEIIKDYVKIA